MAKKFVETQVMSFIAIRLKKIYRSVELLVLLILILAISDKLPTRTSYAQIELPERLEITIDPKSSPNGWTFAPTLSASGDLVAFVSEATNLVASDTNNTADIFLHNISTGETQLISRSSDSIQANGRSWAPVISADGRFIVFVSLASNLASRSAFSDMNGLADVYLYDRQSKTTVLVSVNTSGRSATGWSDQPAISGDGRIIVFISTAQDLIGGPVNSKRSLFIHDRTTSTTKSIQLLRDPLDFDYEVSSPVISIDGRYIGFIAHYDTSSEILLHDRLTSQTIHLPGPEPSKETYSNPYCLSISGDGSFLVAAYQTGIAVYNRKSKTWSILPEQFPDDYTATNTEYQLSISSQANSILSSFAGSVFLIKPKPTNHFGDTSETLISTRNSTWPTISSNGSKIVYVKEQEGFSELFIQQQSDLPEDSTLVTGWVGDGLGHPIVGVSLSAFGKSTRTDQEGNFSLQVPSHRNLIVLPQKQGFTFSPARYYFAHSQNTDHVAGVSFVAQPDDIVMEASKDIGMPYSLDRGCLSPFESCGGPFHGFYRGDCTDLVLDAYLHGVDLNIQLALELDFQRNPRHFYRWRNARNSQDMWRLFSYAGLILTPGEPYQIGDIVFFDWESDAIIDHVAVISEVSSRHLPQKMVDAIGFIADNPDGLAAELPWMPYHTTSTPGHARWTGSFVQQDVELPPDIPILIIAMDSPAVRMRVLDLANRSISVDLIEIASAQRMSTGVGEVVSIDDPLASSDWYFIEISSLQASPYQIGIQTIQAKDITYSSYLQGELSSGEILLIPIHLVMVDGRIIFTIPDS